jgi:hypothetical protein
VVKGCGAHPGCCGKAEGLEIDIVDEEEVGITLVIDATAMSKRTSMQRSWLRLLAPEDRGQSGGSPGGFSLARNIHGDDTISGNTGRRSKVFFSGISFLWKRGKGGWVDGSGEIWEGG